MRKHALVIAGLFALAGFAPTVSAQSLNIGGAFPINGGRGGVIAGSVSLPLSYHQQYPQQRFVAFGQPVRHHTPQAVINHPVMLGGVASTQTYYVYEVASFTSTTTTTTTRRASAPAQQPRCPQVYRDPCPQGQGPARPHISAAEAARNREIVRSAFGNN